MCIRDRIRRAIPDIALTTDIIVGYPGETEQDFEETLDVVRKVEYDSAFTFIYSKRTGTPAAAKEDQVPQDVVKERFDRLLKLVQDISAKKTQKDVGTIQQILVEEQNQHDANPVSYTHLITKKRSADQGDPFRKKGCVSSQKRRDTAGRR